VAVTPIEARCRRCHGELHLYELVEGGSGECPRCQRPLSPDWTPVVLEESKRADPALRALVASLRRLVGLPGNLDLLPSSVLRNLIQEVGWEQDLAAEPEVVGQEVRRLRRQLEAWEALDPAEQRAGQGGLAASLRALADRLRGAEPQDQGLTSRSRPSATS
jgi:hypothetical protein